jgi:hypothetical protein
MKIAPAFSPFPPSMAVTLIPSPVLRTTSPTRGEVFLTPSPLMGEGWGEGVVTEGEMP